MRSQLVDVSAQSPQMQQQTITSHCVPTDNVVRTVASRLAQHVQNDADPSVLLGGVKPDSEVVRSLIRLAWASSSGDYHLLDTPWDELGTIPLNTNTISILENEYSEDMLLCKYVPRFEIKIHYISWIYHSIIL